MPTTTRSRSSRKVASARRKVASEKNQPIPLTIFLDDVTWGRLVLRAGIRGQWSEVVAAELIRDAMKKWSGK